MIYLSLIIIPLIIMMWASVFFAIACIFTFNIFGSLISIAVAICSAMILSKIK